MKILNFLAILLSVTQVGFVAYFLTMYATDNMPLFMFLLTVALVNILAVVFSERERK